MVEEDGYCIDRWSFSLAEAPPPRKRVLGGVRRSPKGHALPDNNNDNDDDVIIKIEIGVG